MVSVILYTRLCETRLCLCVVHTSDLEFMTHKEGNVNKHRWSSTSSPPKYIFSHQRSFKVTSQMFRDSHVNQLSFYSITFVLPNFTKNRDTVFFKQLKFSHNFLGIPSMGSCHHATARPLGLQMGE